MAKLNKKTSLIVFGVSLLTVFYFSPQLLALGSIYFDDIGSGDNCDIRRAMLRTDQTDLGNAMCNEEYPQDEPVVLWAGQNNRVNLAGQHETDPTNIKTKWNRASIPFVKAKAYFKITPTEVRRLSDKRLDIDDMRRGDRTIEIRGANLCRGSTLNADRQDKVEYGYFENYPNAYQNRESTGTSAVTLYEIGNLEQRGFLRAAGDADNPCSYNNNKIVIDLKDLNSGAINPVPGIENFWSVDIIARHLDNSPGAGYDRDRTPPSDKNDGLENSFKIAQACDTARLSNCEFETLKGVSSAGTNAQATITNPVKDFSPAEGYVVTAMRGTNGSRVLNTEDEQGGNGGDPDATGTFRNNYSTLTTKFGSDCTVAYDEDETPGDVNGGPRYRLTFYDLDFVSAPGPGEPRIRVYDQGTSKTDTSDDYWLWPGDDFSDNAAGESIKGNNGIWRRQVPSYAQSIAPPNALDKQYYVVTFPAVKDHDYRLEILNIFDGRLSQWSVPFDSVYYEKPCKWDAKASLVWDKSEVFADETATVTASIENTGVETDKLTWSGQVWIDNGDKIAGAGDTQLENISSTPPGISVDPGQTVEAFKRSRLAPSNYKYLCASFTVGNQPDDKTVIVPAGIQCIPIVISPDFRVSQGDVRAGGAYKKDLGCNIAFNPLSAPPYDTQYRIQGRDYGANTLKGSYGQYGAFAPGLITGFGSNGVPHSTSMTLAAELLTFGSAQWQAGAMNGRYFGATASPSLSTYCLGNFKGTYSQIATDAGQYSSSVSRTKSNSTDGIYESGQYTLNGNSAPFSVCKYDACDRPVAGSTRVIYLKEGNAGVGTKPVARIESNVTIPDAYTDITQIPLTIIIVEDGVQLEFAEGVTRFDGIIVSESAIKTCNGHIIASAIGTNCGSQLVINGSVVTSGEVFPYRTSSVGEIFNLSPQAILGDYVRTRQQPTMNTVDQYELPPRF